MPREAVLQVKSLIRVYHEYIHIWMPHNDDEYQLKREPLNTVDPNAVAIVRQVPRGRSYKDRAPRPRHPDELGSDFQVLGNVPKLMRSWLTKFLKRATSSGKAVIKGKRIDRGGGYGLEVPCECHFTEDKFTVARLKSKLENEVFELKLGNGPLTTDNS